MLRTILLLLTLITCTSVTKKSSLDLTEVVEVLKEVETLGDTQAIGDGGLAYGILQIHEIYVEEVNQKCGTNYTHEDMFNEGCAEEVFYLYMKLATKRFKRVYNKLPSEEDIVRMHNGGMYQGHRINATKKYYKRYLNFKKG